ncbi:glycoside hydrolase family 25 domain-containing protein [Streptacidiphilus fuscans]|uniref:Uncharacterized protein n=1 Tax=Streptacidiphilus fuscans TaxID=2789292 RepID=A0A931BAH9_9ACTN|nr:hypothetical protein [Streptacidiphilus fuscans]MBF9073599.1 hypothetical protein [Streptacidiphilus fuscans]
MTRTMYDSVDVASLPAGAPLYAGYLDGSYANVPQLRAAFPHAVIVEIVVSSQNDGGHVLDVEQYDAAPQEAPGWVQRRRAAGVDPSVYCNSSTWPSVRSAFQAQGVAEPHYWIAQYDGDPAIPAGAVAKQYNDLGGYDISSVADYWPGIDPQEPDVPLTEADAQLVARTLLATTIPNQFRKDAQGHPANTPVNAFFTFGDHHYDELTSQLTGLAGQVSELTKQVAALSAAVAKLSTPAQTAPTA